MRIVNEGMGGFLNPPGDAEYNWSVRSVRSGRDNYSSLRYALTEPYYVSIKADIERKLVENPPQFTTDWEQQVYAYFRNCYSPDGTERNVSVCVITSPWYNCPRFNPRFHLAYLHIKKFFPDYEPNLDLIDNPGKWGKG